MHCVRLLRIEPSVGFTRSERSGIIWVKAGIWKLKMN